MHTGKKYEVILNKHQIAILTLLFLGACDCSGSKGEGCGLLAAEAGAVIAAPVALAAAPIIVATTRGPEPRVDEGSDLIKLESSFEVVEEDQITGVHTNHSNMLIVSGPEKKSFPDRQTSFWSWQGEPIDFAGHSQSDVFVTESSSKLFFIDFRNAQPGAHPPHTVDMVSGVSELVSLPPCDFLIDRPTIALSDKEGVTYCIRQEYRGTGFNKVSTFDPETQKIADLYNLAPSAILADAPRSVKDGVVGQLMPTKTIEWRNYGPTKLSGAREFDAPIWSIASVPHKNMIVVTLSQDNHKGKVELIDLEDNKEIFLLDRDESQITTAISPDGHYLLVAPNFSHQIDLYDLVNLKTVASISIGEKYHFGLPVFDTTSHRFAVYTQHSNKVYIFSVQ